MAQVSRTPKDLKGDASSAKPGSISKRLLTPCWQVGLSRKRKTPCSATLLLNSSVTSDKDNSPDLSVSATRSTKSKTRDTADSLNTPLSTKNSSNTVNNEGLTEILSPAKVESESENRNTAKRSRLSRDRMKKQPVSRCLLPEEVDPSTEKSVTSDTKEEQPDSNVPIEAEQEVAMEQAEEKPKHTKEKTKKSDKKSKNKVEKELIENKVDPKKSIRKIKSDIFTPVIQLEQLDLSDTQIKNDKPKLNLSDDDDAFTSTPDEDKFLKDKKTKKPNADSQQINETKKRPRKVRRIISEEGSDLSGSLAKDDNAMSFEASEKPVKKRIIDSDEEFLPSPASDKIYTPEEVKDIVGAKEIESTSNSSTKIDKPPRKSKSFRRILSMKKTDSFEEATEKSPHISQTMIKVDYIKENIEPKNENREENTKTTEESPDNLQEYDIEKIVSETMSTTTIPYLDKEEEEFTSSPGEDKFTKPELLKKIAEIEARLKQKKDEVAKLKQAKIYRKKHNLEELDALYNIWRTGCKTALNDLLAKLQSSQVIDMRTLLERFQVPSDVFAVSPTGELV